MGGVLTRTIEIRCWQAKPRPLTKNKLSNKLKNGIEILVGQAVFKLWIKTVKCFDQYLKNCLTYLKV